MNIFESISAVMAEVGAIGKNSKNTQQGFMFRGIDAVMNAINPALVKYKMFIVPTILEQTREERVTSKGNILIYSVCKVKYTFYAEDGSSIDAVVIGEGMDSGDKATNKAMSIAFKYACFQVFCIPTEEMVDPDAECHEVQPKQASKPTEKPKKESKPVEKPTEQPTEQQMEKVVKAKIDETKIIALMSACKNNGVAVEKILKLYKVASLTDLTEGQYSNINQHWEDIKKA